MYKIRKNKQSSESEIIEYDRNPLEFKVALIFTLMYVAFIFITYIAITSFGTCGLNVVAMVVGDTDIDPFLLNIFQGKYALADSTYAHAALLSIIGNNIAKTVYAYIFANHSIHSHIITGFSVIIIINIFLALMMFLF